MRTRFLNTDYFAASSSSVETLRFLDLPVPHLLPPPPCLSNLREDLLRFDPLPNISLEIERFPFDAALSKFISEAVPQIVDVDYGDDRERFTQEKEAKALYGEEEEHNQRAFTCQALEDEFSKESQWLSHNDDKTVVDYKHAHRSQVIKFEQPELHEFLENGCLSEEGIGTRIFSEVQEIENSLDLLRTGPSMQNSNKAQEAVYLVQDINLEDNMDLKASASEEDATDQEQAQFYHSFPLLEVDEISIRIFTDASVDDELLSYLGNVNSQRTKRDYPNDGMELLGSLQYDSPDFVCIHFLSNHCLESDQASVDMFPAMDIISLVETSNGKEEAVDCLSPTRPIVFQEFRFLDVDSSQLCEGFFDMKISDHRGTCDWMFEEDMNLKNFNDLVISSELAPVDDTFKSLPIPNISDHDKIRSINSVAEDILSHLMQHPLSASNVIYMDWNLLEDYEFSPDVLSFYQYKFEDLDSHISNFDWKVFGDGKLKVDLVFCDDASDGPKVEEHEELLDMHYTSYCQLMDPSSSKLLSNPIPKSEHGEHIAEENAEKASLLFKSMSQFNDLEFFLNPRKATDEVERESTVQTHDTNAKVGASCSVLSLNANTNQQSLEELLNATNIGDKFNARLPEAADAEEACCTPNQVPHVAHAKKSGQLQGGMASFPDTIIIMNTQNFDKEMIISRRSTYQRILAREKEGAQVIERDLDLPVDAIISSSICFIWYDCRNIGKKATNVDEASSSLPLCIEDIATNVLTRLSFTFSLCILVFEGEISFLSTVMESSDGLYAAASSLGVDLQLFCSYSPELTDEIILSSIFYATKLYRGIYPQMPESETLAETFLTKFPSVNPLTAHAMLSSGGMLIELFEWPHDHRILAVQQYHVPDESIALFSALCRYGEREDSKSVMTDRSSSVSSGPSSDKCHFNIESHKKQQTCVNRSQKMDIYVDDVWQSELLNQFTDGLQHSSEVCKLDDRWMSKDIEILDELKLPNPSSKILFCQNKEADAAGITNPSLILNENKRPRSAKNDKLFSHNRRTAITAKNNFDCINANKNETQCKDFNGEIIDFDDDALMDIGIPSIPSPTNFSTWLLGAEEESTGKSKAIRRLSFGKNSHPTFPTAAEIDSGTHMWTAGDQNEILHSDGGLRDTGVDRNKVSFEQSSKFSEELLMQQSAGSSKRFSFNGQIPHNSGTPLSRAIHSKHPQAGSPWTIEFLNRIREKSRLRQQSLPCDSSSPISSIPAYGVTTNVSRVTRRSPSILEFFKYQGGSTPRKIPQQKKQKQSAQILSTSKIESTSASILPTWTPIDKRSSQTLSFALNESGNQTKLVWTDGSAHHLSKKFRSQ